MKTAEDILKEKNRSIVSVNPDMTVLDALRAMVENKIGAVAVKEGDEYIGIYSERDLVRNSIQEGFDPAKEIVRNVMTKNLICASHDDTLHQLQDKLLGKRLRHLFITEGEKVIGIVSAGDVTRADLNEHEDQLKSVGWDYYENWRWSKKK